MPDGGTDATGDAGVADLVQDAWAPVRILAVQRHRAEAPEVVEAQTAAAVQIVVELAVLAVRKSAQSTTYPACGWI